jgi:hypothetical protein
MGRREGYRLNGIGSVAIGKRCAIRLIEFKNARLFVFYGLN